MSVFVVPVETTTQQYDDASTTTVFVATEDPGKLSLVINESITCLDIGSGEYVPIISAALCFAVLIAIGIIAVTLFSVVLIRGRRKFHEFPFFAIVYHLTTANAVHMLMLVTTVLPIMLIESTEDTPQRVWYQWGSRILMVTEYASLYFTLLMTVNRMAVFVFTPLLKVFTKLGIHLMALCIWAYIFFIVYWNVNYGTVKSFSKKLIAAEDILLGDNLLTRFFTVSSTVLPVVMLAMYGIIFAFIIKKRTMINTSKQNERDRSLLWQALMITISLELTNLTSMATPLVQFGPTWVLWTWTIFIYSISILNQMINPLLFLVMNKMVQSVLLHFFDKNFSNMLSESSSHGRSRGVGGIEMRHNPCRSIRRRLLPRRFFKSSHPATNAAQATPKETVLTF